MENVEQSAASTPATQAAVENQEPTAEATGAAAESAPKAGTPESAFEALRKADGFKQVGKAPEKAKAEEPDAEAAATDKAEPAKAEQSKPAADKQAKAPKTVVDGVERLQGQIKDGLAERNRIRRENEQLQAQNDRLKVAVASGKPLDSPTRESAKPSDGKPARPSLTAITKEVGEDKAWDTYEERLEDYTEKLADWKLGQRTSQEANAKQRESDQQLVADAIAKHGDFEDVAFADDLKVTDAMAAYLWKQGEVGLEMLYHLGQNKPEAAKIARLSQLDQIEALVGLKQKFTKDAPKGGSQNGAARQVSKASPPPDEVRGNSQAPIDPAKAALAKGNFGEFRRIEAEKRIAALKK